MHIYVDESGHFVESTSSEIGIIVLATITDRTLVQFEEFYKELFGEQWTDVKASQLAFPIREKLMKFIGKHPEIRYTAFVYDYEATSEDAISVHKEAQVKKIEEAIKKVKPIAVYPSLVDDLEMLLRQIKKLSLPDYMKVILIVEVYRSWIQTFAFDYVYTHTSRDSWDIKHVLDMQTKPGKFIRLVYSLLYATTNSLAGAKHRVFLPKEWNNDHPFLEKYDTEEGVDLAKLLKDQTCGDDSVHVGLKIPDLISNTLLRSLQRQDEKKWSKILKRILPNRSFVHIRGRAGGIAYYTVGAFPGGVENITEPSEKVKKHWKSMKDV